MHSLTMPMALTQPTLCLDPITLHKFSWTNGLDPTFWLQTDNQMYRRNLKMSKSPYQSGNLTAFGLCLGPRRGGYIVDVGANVGLMCYYFARQWGARVLAVEPTPKLAQMLQHNMVINGVADQVTLLQKAAYNVNGPLTFRDIPSQGYINQILTTTKGPRKGCISSRFTVDGITLDSLNLSELDGIKIDTEGSELQVCEGAINTITKYRPVVMAEMLRLQMRYNPDHLYQFFLDLDYTVFDKGARAHGRTPQPCGTKWVYKRDRSDKIFVPNERAEQLSVFLY